VNFSKRLLNVLFCSANPYLSDKCLQKNANCILSLFILFRRNIKYSLYRQAKNKKKQTFSENENENKTFIFLSATFLFSLSQVLLINLKEKYLLQ
jgi:hypothetical protein